MIIQPTSERVSEVLTDSGKVSSGPLVVSAITLDGGTAATGATVILDNSADGSGTALWVLRVAQYGSASISFSKPIPFSIGCYATLTGTASKVAVAYA